MGFDFFENKECQFYPCHDFERINCLFCFCPLYCRDDCGGEFKRVEIDGKMVKDCSECELPHSENGYSYIMSKLKGL